MKIKCLSNLADRMLGKRGWNKVEETDKFVAYEKYNRTHNYTACIEIAHHKHIPNTVCCFDSDNIKGPDYFSPSVGMSGIVMWAALLKMIGMGLFPDTEAKENKRDNDSNPVGDPFVPIKEYHGIITKDGD